MSANNENPPKQRTFLSYVLTSKQDAWVNYFVPSLTSLILYVFLFAGDVSVIFRHYKDDNPIWASLTLFFIYLPSLCSYIVIISSWELWPYMLGCGRDNFVWFMTKTIQHLCFPVWAMWRYAEKIFWSIEAIRATDEQAVASAVNEISAPRTIELYFFCQAFLHSLPQILLQLNVLMRQDYIVEKQTADAQILSFVFNLAKVAATVAFYQRFRSQKLAGRQYPWYKQYKLKTDIDYVDGRVKNGNRPLSLDTGEPPLSESRRSSDLYMEPELREAVILRETSIIDGPQRRLYQDEPDFNIRRVVTIKGLPEDDQAGKLVSFCWWSCFLLARILAISTFFFFYPKATILILALHFAIVIAFLFYDAKSDEVQRGKAVFFVFIGLIYIFCIIEFKIRFKKTKFMYCGYFVLVFVENFIMCMIWWTKNVEDLQNDFWFRYIFYVVVMGSIISVFSMLFYLNINKPKKVVRINDGTLVYVLIVQFS